MHFHVTETRLDGHPRPLGGHPSIRYPSELPTFRAVEAAIDSVALAAIAYWGLLAGAHVELALLQETNYRREWSPDGALAGWADPGGDGAWWSVRACDCADGTLARMFTDGDS